jgi:hypothetical protein
MNVETSDCALACPRTSWSDNSAMCERCWMSSRGRSGMASCEAGSEVGSNVLRIEVVGDGKQQGFYAETESETQGVEL